jgi:two-component system, chemotaxis family, sensor kinase CheA
MTAQQGSPPGSSPPGIDENRLRRAFLEETEELLQKLNDSLEGLEGDRANKELVNEAFRAIHSLKSESALMGFSRFSELAHRMEDVLGRARDGALAVEKPVLDRIFAGSDVIAEMLGAIQKGGDDSGFDTASVVAELSAAPHGSSPARESPSASVTTPGPAAQANLLSRIGDAERLHLAEARDRGEAVYRVGITLDESEPMKYARAYLLVANLELAANVIAFNPPLDGGTEDDSLFGRLEGYVTTRAGEGRVREAVGVDQVKALEVERVDYAPLLSPPGPAPGQGTGAGAAPASAGAAGGQAEGQALAAEAGPASGGPGEAGQGQPAGAAGRQPAEKTTIRVDTRRLDDLWSSIAELFLQKSRILRVYERVSRGEKGDLVREELGEAFDSLEKISSSMQQSMMETRMVPISVIFSKFPRLVRDLSRKLGKPVTLAISGEETEIDRAIVEALSDPLTHIIRNSLDHGIEFPEERVRLGKPEKGTVRISAFQQGGNIVIELEDDGRGINVERVRQKALSLGIAGAAGMQDARLLDLIFMPGFSTKDVVTDLSGRGVGMDVVATRIRGDLKGDVRIHSQPGEGTLITLILPLTLTIVNALLVRVESQLYAIPISGVESTAKILNTEIRGEEGRWSVNWAGKDIPLYNLGILHGRRLRTAEEYFSVILGYGMERGCLVVDELLEEQEIVIKPVDDLINHKGLFSGCSILEDGTLVFILDTSFVQGGIL